MHRISTTIPLLLSALICVAGCDTGGSVEENPTSDSPSSDSLSVTLPVIEETTEEILEEMRNLEPYSEEIKEEQFKATVKLDEIRKELGVEGFEQAQVEHSRGQHAEVDPVSGEIAWRALTCFNPECFTRGRGGGPYLFVYPMPNMKIGPDGKVVIDPNVALDMSKPATCPLCNSFEYVRIYEPPEAMVRRQELMAELAEARRAAYEDRRAGRLNSKHAGRAAEIMNELDNLTKLFLVPEPNKVRDVGGVTAPAMLDPSAG